MTPCPRDSENQEGSESLDLDDENRRWTAERLLHASYKDLGSPAEVERRFLDHLLRHCRVSIERLLSQTSTTTKDYSITIDAFDFLQADPVLGNLLLRYPATLLPLLEAAVVKAQRECLRRKQEELGPREVMHLRVKGEKGDTGADLTRVHARLVHLPPTSTGSTPSLSRVLQASHVGRMVQVSGTVVRTSNVQMYESARTFCCKECHRTFVVAADVEQRHNALRTPEQCPLVHEAPASSNANDSSNDGKHSAGRRCRGTKFKLVPDGSIHTDYQEIKIQETSNNNSSATSIGQIPRSLLVKVQHDLVDTCQPGDQVIVVGSLLAQWPAQGTLVPDEDCQVDMAMMAHSVRVVDDHDSSHNASSSTDLEQYQRDFDQYWLETAKNQELPIQARDFICQAVCPKLYGMAIIKLALLLTLIGGVSSDVYQQDNGSPSTSQGRKRRRSEEDVIHDQPDQFKLPTQARTRHPHSTAWNGTQPSSNETGTSSALPKRNGLVHTRRRDQSHLLLVGDPGLGKSQFLKFAAALAPRSVLTTGVGTTSAGLTCAAVREGNTKEFSLEAGALVLADKGVCCIDEFGCIRNEDRTTIHEAMEQQTLSVAKAGIVCKLNCRATIVAVMNPRDCIYDNQSSLSVNTGLGTPLLSRFDLIFKLVDSADAERDNNVTMYLLNRAIQGAGLDVGESTNEDSSALPWSIEKLRAYVALVKERFQPAMSDGAALLLERHYERCRSCQSNTIPVTVRFLESMIRLSQAHARLMYRNTVTVQDAVAVIRLMECSAFAFGGFDGSNVDDFEGIMYCDPMTVDFSDEADTEFACFEYRILERYNMLAYMPQDRRRRADRVMRRNDNGDYSGTSIGWNEFGNPRDRG